MMVALVLQLAMVLLSTQVSGQEKKIEPAAASTVDMSNKVEIKKEELPEATKKVLAGNELKDWMFVKAYRVKTKVKDANGKEIEEYEVELKKDKVTQVLLFDKDGNLKVKEDT